MKKRVCLNCNIEFYKKPKSTWKQFYNQKFCSKKCWREKTKIFPRYCLTCKKIFKPLYNSAIFCSNECRYKFRIGKPSWNKGKKGLQISWSKGLNKFNNLSVKKIAESKIGKKRNDLSGNKSRWWKGGITPLNKKLRKTTKYSIWRFLVFKRDDYTCQICGKRGKELQADHIKPFALYPELRCELSNGRTLCVKCHKETPTYLYKFKSFKEI